MKKLLIGGGVLVAVIVVAVVVLVTNLGSAVKTAIETVGPKVTQTEVTVADVQLSVSEGTGAIEGLHVGNPEGFQTPRAMDLKRVSVRLDTASVTSDKILVHEVVIDAPEMTYEVAQPRSNFQQIRKNVQDYIGGGSGGGDSGGDSGEDAGGGKTLVIEDLYVRDARVGVSAPFLQGEDVSTRLPEIHLQDIGKGEGGATPAEVAARTLDAISARVIAAVGEMNLKGMVEDAAGELEDKAGEAMEGEAGKALDEAGSAAEDALDSITGN